MSHIQATLKTVLTIAIMAFFGGMAIEVQAQTHSEETIVAKEANKQELAEVYSTDFEKGADDWLFVDEGWKVKQVESTKANSSKVLSQHIKKSNYVPKFRSPFHIALLKDNQVESFQVDTKVLSTHKDYDHRDACLFFGYQSPTQYYYVHLGKKMDPHANQIFIVNNEARTKISFTTTDGTNWDEKWHHVRVARDVTSGDIKIYFDDMETPVMTAVDKTFTWGQVGVGSFDDTADWDDFALKGVIRKTEAVDSEKAEAKASADPVEAEAEKDKSVNK